MDRIIQGTYSRIIGDFTITTKMTLEIEREKRKMRQLCVLRENLLIEYNENSIMI